MLREAEVDFVVKPAHSDILHHLATQKPDIVQGRVGGFSVLQGSYRTLV